MPQNAGEPEYGVVNGTAAPTEYETYARIAASSNVLRGASTAGVALQEGRVAAFASQAARFVPVTVASGELAMCCAKTRNRRQNQNQNNAAHTHAVGSELSGGTAGVGRQYVKEPEWKGMRSSASRQQWWVAGMRVEVGGVMQNRVERARMSTVAVANEGQASRRCGYASPLKQLVRS